MTLLAEYEKHENRKTNKISVHMKCAENLYMSVIQNKKSKGK